MDPYKIDSRLHERQKISNKMFHEALQNVHSSSSSSQKCATSSHHYSMTILADQAVRNKSVLVALSQKGHYISECLILSILHRNIDRLGNMP